MRVGLKSLSGGLLSALILALAQTASAQTVYLTGWGHITYIAGGWVQPSVRVQMDIPFVNQAANPTTCNYTDGYIVDAASPANQLLASLLMTAYSQQKSVRLTYQGCVYQRPAIIGVEVQG